MAEPLPAAGFEGVALSGRDRVGLAALLLLLPLLRFFIAQVGGFDLHFDEAQYWEWSQRLDWSYATKGPLVAWLIAASTALFGHGEWQVRLFAWLAYDLFLFLLFGFARQLWQSRRAGWWAVALGLTTPLYFPLGQVMTTDVFLFVCWTWALWAAWRALERLQTSAWYELGAAVGIGGLAKFSVGLLPLFLGLGLLATPSGRRELMRWPPWGGVLLALLMLSPVLLWNAGHGWAMLHHEQGHLIADEQGGWRENTRDLLEFLAGQWLVLSPLVAVAMVRALARPPRPAGERWLWGLSLAVLGFFLAKAALSKVQLNWPAPFRELRWWRAPVETVAGRAEPVHFLMVPSYHLAGRVAFYWPERLPVYPVGEDRRFSQHDFWPGIEREAGHDGVYVATGDQLPQRVVDAFARCMPLPPVPATTDRNGRAPRTLYSWRCEGYRPTVWPKPKTY